jgi:dTDP-4-amino-4,6-dideoxygalactose transaminase
VTIAKETMRIPFVDLKAMQEPLMDEIEGAISQVLKNTAFILGEEVSLFEEAFASLCETDFAVGVDSGTSALDLALRAFDIGPGDEVITVANTFIATTLAITSTGAQPVLVDIDPETYNIDVAAVEAAITERTKAIIPVHLYGQPAEMDPILELAKEHDLIVIEDACQAHGARYKGRRAGSMGHAAAFSFYPAKNLGAAGDGGMVVTSDEAIDHKLRMLRNYGQPKKYHHDVIGYNRRLDALQAALLRVKLPYLDSWNTARRTHADLYSHLLADSAAVVPAVPDHVEPVWHLYVIRVEDRDGLQSFLSERGISTGIHYPIPIHLQPAYASLGYAEGDFPITERFAKQILSLPMYPDLEPDMIKYVVEQIQRFSGHS